MIIIENFAKNSEFLTAAKLALATSFQCGATSTNAALPIWRGEAPPDTPLASIAANGVARHFAGQFRILHAHLNLQTHGLDGAFHSDIAGPGDATTHSLTWYLHEEPWPSEFGGFLLVEGGNDGLAAVLPRPNSAILLRADVLHCALSPLRLAGARARISLSMRLAAAQ